MKLTNYMRDEFINKVLNKTVNIDYISQIQEMVNKEAYAQLPSNLQNKDTMHYLDDGYVRFDGARCMGRYIVKNKEYKPSQQTIDAVKIIHDLSEAQEEKKHEVRGQLRGVIYGCTTLKRAMEFLPEALHQYLPVENEVPKNQFAVATTELMDNLKSLGMQE